MLNSSQILVRDSIIGPYQIALDITNRCNYRCLHCYNASGENSVCGDELSDDEVLSLINEVAQIKPQNFCFCGGEPLLRIDLLTKCASILHVAGIQNIALVSNGYYMTPTIYQMLVGAHVNNVQISLDGFTQESCYKLRQNELAFERAINALEIISAQKGNPTCSVAFCPTKYNIEEFDDVYNFCINKGVKQLRVQPLMIIGRASKNVQAIMPSHEQYIELIRKIYKYKENACESMFLEWGDPLDHVFRLRNAESTYAIAMNIKSNGDIEVSPYLPITSGNVRRHSITDYWNAGYQRIWKLPEVQKMAEDLYTVEKMNGAGNIQNSWFDADLHLDLIDDNIELG